MAGVAAAQDLAVELGPLREVLRHAAVRGEGMAETLESLRVAAIARVAKRRKAPPFLEEPLQVLDDRRA